MSAKTTAGEGSSRIAILGAGSWGTALARLLAENHHQIRLWMRDQEAVERLSRERENKRFLPGFPLAPEILVTSELSEALANCEAVIFAVPSGALREVANEAASSVPSEALLLSATKGLEDRTGLRMSRVLAEIFPDADQRTVVLSGPNLAVEVARGVPTASVAASNSAEAALQVQALFTGAVQSTFRVYTGNDVIGVELGGAIKNVIAIGAGICDGLGYGDNAKAALMTRGLTETIRLGVAQGAEAATFMGLSGVGDLIATGNSRLSRNYRVGIALGQGRALFDILAELGQVAEGVPTTRALCELAASCRVEMPLCSGLRSVLHENRLPLDVIHSLMLRPPKTETLDY